MKEGTYSQRIDFGDFTKAGKRRQQTDQAPPFQRQSHSQEEQEAHRERGYHSRAGKTPDEQEEQRRKKQAEEKRYREILFAYRSRPLTEDEWKLLESRPLHKGLFGKLSFEEELQYGDVPKFIKQDLRQRATEYLTGYLRDRYPSWWQVWDENGKPITRMSPQHKASLARMRQFESLAPEEKYEELKKTFPTLFTAKGGSGGEKFTRVIDGLFELLLSLFGNPEYDDPLEPQQA